MNTEKFVERIKQVAVEQGTEAIESILCKPPGRKPSDDLLRISRWFNTLGDEERGLVLQIIRQASQYSAFTFCCVLDGVVKITDPNEVGEFELSFVEHGQRIRLNTSEGEMLHDILNRV